MSWKRVSGLRVRIKFKRPYVDSLSRLLIMWFLHDEEREMVEGGETAIGAAGPMGHRSDRIDPR